ncbi:MAG: rod shape-determining protein MreC [Candidatus Omnitrophica bacterium]|nr:rod shape-determining protein MreC [Candidatus Omnitrophota bacterium]MDE2008970.1 rod shape-determining protein MreC [Candidatus Omnitrophota bacterium]MDE2214494.1 rod shape-determining protein MreC [Candidatus Omnitrophota bacterium]MDE2230812.1 rod shape-determining protein MreC [Candidatus Omnitrophota bacterium]
MWRKTFKKAAYIGIVAVPFLILFFHPKNYRAAGLLDAVAGPVDAWQGPVFELKKLFYYRETYDEYVYFKRQNEVLKARLTALREDEEARKRYDKIRDFRNSQSYGSIVADVIGRDPSDWNASLIIDRGRAEGLKVGQPVVNPLGVVGRVFETGEHTAKVVLLSDPTFAVAAVDQRSRENGLLTGTLEGNLRFEYLTDKADVKVGDVLVTSGLSTAFPEGILIGRITNVSASANVHSVDCLVTPAVDLSQLEEVIIIKKT